MIEKQTHKLTREQADEIRRRVFLGESSVKIAEDFNISKTTVLGIKTGRIWSEIKRYKGKTQGTMAEKFWDRVKPLGPNECWLWNGTTKRGTPTLSFQSQTYRAQRISYVISSGVLGDHDWVKNTCGNSLCVNPNHIIIIQKRTWSEADQEDTHRRSKEYYQENKEKAVYATRRSRLLTKMKAIQYLGGVCQDCNLEVHPAAFQFHHRNPSDKKFTLNTVFNSPKKYPWDTHIVPELNKCDLLCGNCHQIRHSNISSLMLEEIRKELNGE